MIAGHKRSPYAPELVAEFGLDAVERSSYGERRREGVVLPDTWSAYQNAKVDGDPADPRFERNYTRQERAEISELANITLPQQSWEAIELEPQPYRMPRKPLSPDPGPEKTCLGCGSRYYTHCSTCWQDAYREQPRLRQGLSI